MRVEAMFVEVTFVAGHWLCLFAHVATHVATQGSARLARLAVCRGANWCQLTSAKCFSHPPLLLPIVFTFSVPFSDNVKHGSAVCKRI